MGEKDKGLITSARKDELKGRKMFNGERGDDEDVYMILSYKLPLACDNIFFIPETERCPGAMSNFYLWDVFDDPDKVNFDDKVDVRLNTDEMVSPTKAEVVELICCCVQNESICCQIDFSRKGERKRGVAIQIPYNQRQAQKDV